jgi:dUTP pyrophosphatase
MFDVKVKKLSDDAVIPQYQTEGASGFDLVADTDVVIKPGESVLVPTGLAFEIPQGLELQIRPRSGTSYKTKLRVANTPGTIDADYRGEVKVLLDNITVPEFYVGLDAEENCVLKVRESDTAIGIDGSVVPAPVKVPNGTYYIKKGERVAQAVLVPVAKANLIVVDELSSTDRGAGGFGSTGTN